MAGVAVFTLSLDSFAQSVADAAKKERDRQKSVQSKIVITGSGGKTTTTTPESSAAKPPVQGGVKPVEIKDNKGRDEKYWRTAFEKARGDLKRAESKVEILDLKLKELNTAMLQKTDVYNREYKFSTDITATQKQLEDAHKEVDQAKQKLTDLEEELRKSGGPPGWAR